MNLLVLGGLSATYVSLGLHPSVPLAPAFTGGFLLGTLLITPDLDFGGRVRVVARRNWGGLEFIWYPLGYLVKHRGITHTYLRGSTLLLLYAACTLGLLAWAVQFTLHSAHLSFPWPLSRPHQLSGLLSFSSWCGYITAYGLHLWMDGYKPWQLANW